MKREIAKAFQGIPAVQDSAMTLFRALPTNQIESLGPFVFVDFYETKGTKGIGDSLILMLALRSLAICCKERASIKTV
ncbi:MAG: hypothetical protein IPQ04_09245 [Saprospiraceae bacterium]|nr:hypothetical protein [Saprospiraceae bacterium]